MNYLSSKYRDSRPPKIPNWEMWCIMLPCMIILIFALSGCTKKVYIPVEKIRTETDFRQHFQRNSIYMHDSVSFSEKGDTIRIVEWHTRWRERVIRDTCHILKTDSIPVPYPVIKEPGKWDRLKIDYGGYALIGILIAVYILIRRKNRS